MKNWNVPTNWICIFLTEGNSDNLPGHLLHHIFDRKRTKLLNNWICIKIDVFFPLFSIFISVFLAFFDDDLFFITFHRSLWFFCGSYTIRLYLSIEIETNVRRTDGFKYIDTLIFLISVFFLRFSFVDRTERKREVNFTNKQRKSLLIKFSSNGTCRATGISSWKYMLARFDKVVDNIGSERLLFRMRKLTNNRKASVQINLNYFRAIRRDKLVMSNRCCTRIKNRQQQQQNRMKMWPTHHNWAYSILLLRVYRYVNEKKKHLLVLITANLGSIWVIV